jgi:LacI family transcriptional regulator
LSSVDVDSQQLGYEAAALLERMMDGETSPEQPLQFPPRSVVPRESTNVLATEDLELATLLRFLRDHACDGLRLKALATQTSLSRRELGRRIRNLLGRSPKEEIVRVQMERAKHLLAETEGTLSAIAQKCGFSQPRYFIQVFHARIGLPPGAYRKKIRKMRKPVSGE